MVAIILVAGLVPAPAAQPAAPVPTVKLGILTGMFRDVSPGLVQAAASPFRDIFKRETGLQSEVILVDDYDLLASQMKDKKLEFGVFHGFEFAWIQEKYPEVKPLVISVLNGNNSIQACLVVNISSKATSPKDLKGACVTLPGGTKAHCHLFLERLCETLPANTCAAIPSRKLSPEEALDAVAADDSPAALVDMSAFTAYQNNKPGAASQLKILAKSEPFPVGVVAYRQGAVDPKVLDKVRTALVKVHENAQGRAFMMLWKLKGFGDPTPEFEADLTRIDKVYPAPKPKLPTEK